MTALLLATALCALAQEPAPAEAPQPAEAGQATNAIIQLRYGDGQTALTVHGLDVTPADATALSEQVQGMQARIDELESRVAALEDRPLPESAAPSAVSWTGATVVADGETVDDAVSYTGPVEVRGTVQGDAVSMVADVHVMPGGRVMGDAVSFGGSVVVDPGGVVVGDRVALGGRASVLSAASPEATLARAVQEGSLWGHARELLHGFARRIAVLLAFAGLGVLIVGFWPTQLDHVSHIVTRRPIWYGVAGGILTGLMGLGAIVFTLTMVGIPIALVLAVLLAIGWLVGIVAICKATGERFSGVRQHGDWASFLVGAGLLMAIGMLPWVGPLFLVALAFPAVGAALVSRLGSRRDPDVA